MGCIHASYAQPGPAAEASATETPKGAPELLCVEKHATVPKVRPSSCVIADERGGKSVSEYPHVVNLTWSSWGASEAQGTGQDDGLAVRLALAKPGPNAANGGSPIFTAITMTELTTGAVLAKITH